LDPPAQRLEDVAPSGYAVETGDRASEEAPPTCSVRAHGANPEAVDDYIEASGKEPGELLLDGRGGRDRCITTC
jgi:hypothetical protein